MKVQICLMSDQLLANYLPLKQLKPDLALLVNTKYTLDKGLDKRLKVLSESQSIAVENAPELAPDDNYTELLGFFEDLKEHIKTQAWTDITLNITGGTKLMSLAAYQVLREVCQQIIYVNTSKDEIQLFQRDDFIQLDNRLIGVDEYLFAQGVYSSESDVVTDAWLHRAQSRRKLTEQFVEFSMKQGNAWFVGALNFQATSSLKRERNSSGEFFTVLADPKRKFKSINRDATALLQACADEGLITYDGKREVEILGVEAAQYLGGVWLEEYCYFLGKELGVHDVRCSQPIIWETGARAKQSVENEIDVIFVHNNRMLIIECKTGNLDSNVVSSNEIIYKLDSIASDFRGLYGNIWLLSAREIKDERILNRASSQKIRIIHGAELANLENEIKKWARLS